MQNIGFGPNEDTGSGTPPELVTSVRVEAVEVAGRRLDAVVVELGGLRLLADLMSHRQLMRANRLAQTHGAPFVLDQRLARAFGVDADELVLDLVQRGPELINRVRVARVTSTSGTGDCIRVHVADMWLWQDVQSDYDLALAARLAASHSADFDISPEVAARYPDSSMQERTNNG